MIVTFFFSVFKLLYFLVSFKFYHPYMTWIPGHTSDMVTHDMNPWSWIWHGHTWHDMHPWSHIWHGRIWHYNASLVTHLTWSHITCIPGHTWQSPTSKMSSWTPKWYLSHITQAWFRSRPVHRIGHHKAGCCGLWSMSLHGQRTVHGPPYHWYQHRCPLHSWFFHQRHLKAKIHSARSLSRSINGSGIRQLNSITATPFWWDILDQQSIHTIYPGSSFHPLVLEHEGLVEAEAPLVTSVLGCEGCAMWTIMRCIYGF